MQKLLIMIFMILPLYTFPQSDTSVVKVNDEVYSIVENMPGFPGGDDALYKFLADSILYPASALEDSVKGTVYVSFLIDKEGVVKNVNIVKGVRKDLDKEALRVVSMMPPWQPGMQKGRPVNVKYNLPIKFSLR